MAGSTLSRMAARCPSWCGRCSRDRPSTLIIPAFSRLRRGVGLRFRHQQRRPEEGVSRRGHGRVCRCQGLEEKKYETLPHLSATNVAAEDTLSQLPDV